MANDIDDVRKIVGKVPWITSEGFLDVMKFPIDGTLRQAVSGGEEDFRNAVSMLKAMLSNGREEAGVFLLGLLAEGGDDWARQIQIVEALAWLRTKGCANFLLGELKRVKSNNTTRRYLAAVLQALARMPLEFVEERLRDLAADPGFSPKMRDKFEELLWDMKRESRLRGY